MSFSLSAETLPGKLVVDDSKKLTLGSHIRYQHADKELTIEALLANFDQIHWRQSEHNVPSLKNTDQAVWLYLVLVNSSDQPLQRTLQYDYPLLDKIDVFLVNSDKSEVNRLGGAQLDKPLSSRVIPHRTFAFLLELPAQSEQHVFIRIENDSYIQVPLYLWEQAHFFETELLLSLLMGAALGVLFVIGIYAAFVYSATKEKSFLYYSLYALFFFLFYATLKGFTLQFVWPQTPIISQPIMVSCLAIALAFICLFNIDFLELRRNSRILYRWFRVFFMICLVVAVSSWFIPHLIRTSLIIPLALSLSVLAVIAGAFAKSDGHTSAGKFTLSWSVIALAFAAFAGNRLGLLERNAFNEYSLIASQLVSFIVLFSALTDRIKSEKRRRLQAQQDAIQHYQMFYDIYEHAVEAHYTTTDDGSILRCNKAFYELVGYKDFETLLREKGSIIHFYINPVDREKLMKQAQERGKIIGYEAEWRRRDGRKIWVSINLRYEENTTDGNVLIGSIINITEKKKTETQLEFLASHDSLTGLLNRREFEKRLNASLLECDEKTKHTLLYMDLDQFKVVNDTCGHKAGDILLRQLTEDLKDSVGDSVLLARLGGDEFGVLLENDTGDSAFVQAFQLKQVVQDFRFVWDSRVFTLGVSIGMVEVDHNYVTIDEVLSLADTACFTAKEQGRNRIHAYHESDEEVKRHHQEMHRVSQINEALENDRFFLVQQTIYPISEPEGQHYELLIRMRDEDNNMVPPGSFLPAAERYNLMEQIDRWVINTYFTWLSQHPEHMKQLEKCSINLSGPSLAAEDMQTYILDKFETYRIPYDKICFEITESLAITQLDRTLSFIKTFRQLGCKFSLDDFGSGFSSYGYLKNLPVDFLKIDGSFVKDMMIDPIDRAMVKSINEVAKAIGMKTIAEFVESPEILAELREIGVDYAQGYAINKPEPLAQLIEANQIIEASNTKS